jgi:hypothetical protein
MMAITGTSLAAAAAAALLFRLFLASGDNLLVMLLAFFAAPLPIMVAALGWGHGAGLGSALAGALLIAFVLDLKAAAVFLGCIGLPAWWLAYLALLGRPGADGQGLTWYPLSRLLAWIAATVTAVVCAAVLSLSTTYAGYQAVVDKTTEILAPVLTRLSEPSAALDPAAIQALTRDFVEAMPIGSAAWNVLVLALDLWLAAKIVQALQRLPRPFPVLADELMLAPWIAGLFVGLLALVWGDGFVALFAAVAAAALAMAFALVGLACLHRRTRGFDARGPVLFGAYALLVFLAGPALLIFAVVGLIDTLLRRQRLARSAE